MRCDAMSELNTPSATGQVYTASHKLASPPFENQSPVGKVTGRSITLNLA